jgi:hypothetical protein
MDSTQNPQIIIDTEIKTKRLKNTFDQYKQELIDLIEGSIAKTKSNQRNAIIAQIERLEKVFEEQQELTLKEKRDKRQLIENNNRFSQTIKKKTFAEALKTNVDKNTINKTKHVLTVYPTEEGMDSKNLKNELRNKIKINKLGSIGINNIRNIRNNGIIIECETKNDCEKLENEINNNQNTKNICKAIIPTKKKPKIIIYNVFSETGDEVVIESLIKQNYAIENYLKDKDIENEIKHKYNIRSKNENFKHTIIEVSPELRKLIISFGKISILWQKCSVNDFISIVRCFNCYGFGHIKSQCKNEKVCSSCSATDHSYTECKSKSGHKTCNNCRIYNSKLSENNLNKKVDEKHDALYKLCPTLIRIKNSVQSKIDYGS